MGFSYRCNWGSILAISSGILFLKRMHDIPLTEEISIPIIVTSFVIGIGGWVLAILFGRKMQKVSLLLNNHLKNHFFHISGSLFFWGGWLSILLVGVGFLWLAWLFYTIAFFSLPKDTSPTQEKENS